MARLIDANALMEFARNHIDRSVDCNDIARFPTIDAVPVVRCGQCAKAKKFHNPQMGDLILCNEYRVFTDECGFCHMGERMKGAAEDDRQEQAQSHR